MIRRTWLECQEVLRMKEKKKSKLLALKVNRAREKKRCSHVPCGTLFISDSMLAQGINKKEV